MKKIFGIFALVILMAFSSNINAANFQALNVKNNYTVVYKAQNAVAFSTTVNAQLSTEKNLREYEFPKDEAVMCHATVTRNGYTISGSCRAVRRMIRFLEKH